MTQDDSNDTNAEIEDLPVDDLHQAETFAEEANDSKAVDNTWSNVNDILDVLKLYLD